MSPWAGGSAVIPAAEKWQTKGGGFYSTFTGEGTLSSDLDYIKRILTNYSATGTLSTAFTFVPGTYVLDFSADSLGANTNYSSASGRVQLDSDIPDPQLYPGVTKSLKWVPSATNSDNIPVSIPVTIGPDGGTVSFLYKVSSEAGYDGLRFRVDGVAQGSPWTGDVGWAEFSVALTSGNHTLTWEFFHDGSAFSAQNTAWLAKIMVTGALQRPSAATGNGKRPSIFNLEDGAIPSVLSTTTWTNSTVAPISGTRSMRTPALAETDSGTHDLVIDTSSLPLPGVVGFDLKWTAWGGDSVSLYAGATRVWINTNDYSTDDTGQRRFDLVLTPATKTVTVRFSKNYGPGNDQGVALDNLSIAYMAEPATINSQFAGEGTLSTKFTESGQDTLASDFSGEGTLTTSISTRKLVSNFSAEGFLLTELGYIVRPEELSEATLGKLASFAVSTSAVPINPAEGSGSVPSINAAFTKGRDPEYALGETHLLKNGAIGSYEGEVVKVGTSEASGVAAISMNTPLTRLNVDLHLFPFIDRVPGLWTAARALDYWTQQCGLFYDKVPGQVLAYASGFGHTDAYGAGTTGRFYERLTSGETATQVVNGRSVRTLGDTATGMTAFHEAKGAGVAVALPKNRRLVFSAGLGLHGSGRMTTVRWNFEGVNKAPVAVELTVTSDGSVEASVGGQPLASTSVPAGATYRLTLSLERLSATSLASKLTVHSDDLAGGGELIADTAGISSAALPGTMKLVSMAHAAVGGAGAQMTRWGTYLAVAAQHPAELPGVQKDFGETKKPFGFVSGFTGNVWNLLNEFCAIARLDARFIDGALQVGPRSNRLASPGTSWARFEVDRERREKFKQVAVVNKQSKPVDTDDAVLWRADSVYQVAAREVFETTVQTPHSILNVAQPEPVEGILPFPYLQGGGQYVVTGADGYIVSPQWWKDNGGKVEVSMTGNEGEIAIKITAPTLDTVRAPYRISEGAGDRPALYVCGSGILNTPKEVHIATGAKNAREGFDSVFESPFIAGTRETFDTAAAMAQKYSASAAEVSYELPVSFGTPTGLGMFPAGALVTDNKRNYRIQDASQTHMRVSGSAVAHTTIGAYVASYPPGSTIKDEKARHAGRTIRQFNIKPLKGDS